MPSKKKPPYRRKKITRDTINLPKAQLLANQGRNGRGDTAKGIAGVPIELFRKSPEEQMDNLVRHQFR